VPKTPRGGGVPLPTGEGLTTGEGSGEGASQEQNFRFWILNRRIVVQTVCFLYSSPKAGLNAVLGIGEGQNAKH